MSMLTRRTLLGAAAAAVATACAPGRDRPVGDAPARGVVTLAIVGILTADLDRSMTFYRVLGLDVPAAPGGDSYRLQMPDGHTLFWETSAIVNGFDPTWTLPPAADRRIVLEFGFTDPDGLDECYRALVAAGAPVRLAPFALSAEIRYAIVEDPDGNQISLRYPAA